MEGGYFGKLLNYFSSCRNGVTEFNSCHSFRSFWFSLLAFPEVNGLPYCMFCGCLFALCCCSHKMVIGILQPTTRCGCVGRDW